MAAVIRAQRGSRYFSISASSIFHDGTGSYTIITFLLVALLANTQKRADQATQHKLNAIADCLSSLMGHVVGDHPEPSGHCDELRRAVRVEQRESAASHQASPAELLPLAVDGR